jgi:SNF2 family DNA or RNA helicase
MREFKHIKGYHIIIVPKSCIPNWMKEFAKWCPEMRVINLIATKE